jgi:exosome complex RNA-binding protein Rrp42 (RNase PH superfamily)
MLKRKEQWPTFGEGSGFFAVLRLPVFVSLTRLGRGFVVDANAIEEASMDAQLIVGVDDEGKVCSVHTRGPQSLPGVGTLEGIRMAQSYAKTRIAVLKAALAANAVMNANDNMAYNLDDGLDDGIDMDES